MALFADHRNIKHLEFELVAFFLYLGFLIFLWVKTGDVMAVLVSHVLFAVLFGIYYFGREFIFITMAPLFVIHSPLNNYSIKRKLKNFKKNIPAEAVIVLAHSDWRSLEAWIKPNFFPSEIIAIANYLTKKKQDFSFYTNASIDDVHTIMLDKSIKEVYFFGHGSSHTFKLSTKDVLYYCDFNSIEHGKEFVHQMHCGTSHGKSLADYVVSESNRSNCFLIRKTITAYDIEKDLKCKTKNLTLNDISKLEK